MNINHTGWNLKTTYSNLPNIFYRKLKINSVSSPKLVILNEPLAQELGLNIERLKTDEAINILAGNTTPQGEDLLAMAYAGHQFGNFTMLGDGRAALIGEQISPKGERFDIQLKGSGRTLYSRGGDGRASLAPMLREYIISEGMHNLQIPTTRSLSVVQTGDEVYRETALPGAVLTRVSKSHIRVGTFEYAAKFGSLEDLRALSDYTIKRHFPDLVSDDNPYLSLLREVIKSQASLIAKWQLVGFIHGVMNTDNMTISGETIDYGPCAFMDNYNPATVFSSIDKHGRYSYENQPNIGLWNLSRFVETLLPLIDEDSEKSMALAKDALKNYSKSYRDNWLKGMRSKIGIFNQEEEDEDLIEELLNLMKEYKADFTNTFIDLTYDRMDKSELYKSESFKAWKEKWENRLKIQEESEDKSKELMKKSNPIVIARNHLVEEALQAAEKQKDYTKLHELLKALSDPYDYSNIDSKYAKAADPSTLPYITYCGT